MISVLFYNTVFNGLTKNLFILFKLICYVLFLKYLLYECNKTKSKRETLNYKHAALFQFGLPQNKTFTIKTVI